MTATTYQVNTFDSRISKRARVVYFGMVPVEVEQSEVKGITYTRLMLQPYPDAEAYWCDIVDRSIGWDIYELYKLKFDPITRHIYYFKNCSDGTVCTCKNAIPESVLAYLRNKQP